MLGIAAIAGWSLTLSFCMFWTLRKVRQGCMHGAAAAAPRPCRRLFTGCCSRPLRQPRPSPPTPSPSPALPCPAPQAGWLRADKDAEQQGLDITQGIGSGFRPGCFDWWQDWRMKRGKY